MEQDDKVVQPGTASPNTTGQVAGADSTQATSPEPTAEEKLAKQIKEQVEKAVAKATAETTEKARREIQAAKDRARAEIETAQRKARMAETTLATTSQRVRELDPAVATELELAQLRAEMAARKQAEQEAEEARKASEFRSQFQEGLKEIVTDLGLDPTDPKIDWAEDAPNYLEAQRRVLKSAAKIKKESDQALRDSIQTSIKAEISKARTDLGLDSVDTTVSAGGSGSSQVFTTSQIANRAFWEKHKTEIMKAQEEGRIKEG